MKRCKECDQEKDLNLFQKQIRGLNIYYRSQCNDCRNVKRRIGRTYIRTSTRRNSTIYLEWRDSVLTRDGFKCRNCEATTNLVAHHIVPWKDSVELRFELSNGLTLCHACHNRHHRNRKGIKLKGLDKRLGIKTGRSFWKGKKFTEEHRKNLSAGKKGFIFTDQHRKKLRDAQTPERLLANSLRLKGRTWRINPDTGKRVWFDK